MVLNVYYFLQTTKKNVTKSFKLCLKPAQHVWKCDSCLVVHILDFSQMLMLQDVEIGSVKLNLHFQTNQIANASCRIFQKKVQLDIFPKLSTFVNILALSSV